MPGRLTERKESGPGAVYILRDDVTTIGRTKDNILVVASESMSGRHAEVRWDGRRYVLSDLGSKNGTWINGERLAAPHPLRPGDVITFPSRPPIHFGFDIVNETITIDPAMMQPPVARRSDAARATPAETPATDNRPALWVDERTAEVWARGKKVTVTAKEYLALTALYAVSGALVSRNELAVKVWPEYQGAVGDENIEQLIYRLRRKLEADPERPRHLITVRGLGYRLITE
jgi:hypothetical protein